LNGIRRVQTEQHTENGGEKGSNPLMVVIRFGHDVRYPLPNLVPRSVSDRTAFAEDFLS
jgi:hypothetical protein